MAFKKRLLKHPAVPRALSWLLSLYIRLVFITSRKIRTVDNLALTYLHGNQNAIYAFWHGRMMVLPAFCPPQRKMRVLISFHRDGALISRVIGHFGQATVSGSTSRGGKAAVLGILTALENGDNVSITPDGPRGPIQILQKGVVTVAKFSGKPVLPVTFSSTHHKRLKSWDRFMLALPFGRIAFHVGEPIFVARDADEEQARLTIEKAMNRQVEMADRKTNA